MVVVVVIVMTTCFAAGVGHAAIVRQLHRWQLLPEPERLTELYFPDIATIPTSYTPGQSQTVSFTVHNREQHSQTYDYRITLETNNATSVAATGALTLKNNQLQTITVPISMPATAAEAHVVITLSNVHESIGYWVQGKP